MGCLGVHFALSEQDTGRLRNAINDEALRTLVSEDIEERWEEDWLYETDKAWDAVHRCPTDGELAIDNGEYPYGLCILGGQQLYKGTDYIISLKTPAQVRDVALALPRITEAILRERYFRLPDSYPMPLSEEDFSYTWEYFSGLPAFFAKAAAAGRHVIFTADQ